MRETGEETVNLGQWAELIEVEQAEELVAVEWAEEKGECGKGGSVRMFRGRVGALNAEGRCIGSDV
jgi:membrane protease subunit (stomatin/prohibitin family)